MATTIEALSTGMTTAVGLANLALVTPDDTGYQPEYEGEVGTTSILFNYEQENQVSLQSDITDHYVEDNTARNDQIALRPETVTVSGVVGELNNVVPPALKAAKKIAEKLFALAYFTPELSATALAVYNTAAQGYQAAESIARSTVSSYGGGVAEISSDGLTSLLIDPTQTQQQIYFQQFYGYWRERTLFTVQTPWAIFKNMAIQSIRAVQGGDSKYSTDFEITFKMIRVATTQSESLIYDSSIKDGRLKSQSSSLNNLGSQSPVSVGPLAFA